MNRRAFVASVAGLVVAPGSSSEVPSATGAAPLPSPSPSPSLDPVAFRAWLAAFRGKALAAGVPGGIVDTTLDGLTLEASILAQDQRQPEFARPISDYVAATVTPQRIEDGRARWAASASWLDPAAVRYGVASEVLVAIWGVESGYGAFQGDHDVVRVFATLGFQGRRGDWAQAQLIAALQMIAGGAARREQLLGSWAGAMGQMQFTPEDYLTYAVDADADGRRDVWGSAPDAVVSAANFLHRKAQWVPGGGWAREVAVPRTGFDYTLVEGPTQRFDAWRALGLTLADGGRLRAADADAPAQLLMPMGWTGPAFLAFPNHFAIRAYNNALSYALAVGLLADRLAGGAPLVQAWPAEAPSSLAERIGAQQALARAGFDPGPADGALGVGTRRAARRWQSAHSLPADGYLSRDQILRLNAELAGAATLSGPVAAL